MEILKLAFRGSFRNLRRTIPLLAIIATGIFTAHIVISYIIGNFEGYRFSIIHGGTGHVQVAKPEQFKGYVDGDIQHTLSPEDMQKVLKHLNSTEKPFTLVPQISTGGMASNGEVTVPFYAIGIDVKGDTPLSRAVRPIIKGKSLRATKRIEFRAVIGRLLAERLNFQVGDVITLIATTKYNAINAIDVNVVGIMATGTPNADSVMIYMPIDNLQFLLDTDHFTKFIILLSSDVESTSVLQKLNTHLDQRIVAKHWSEISPLYHQVKRMNAWQFAVLGLVISIVIFVSVLGAVSASVYERKKHIGLLRALGVSSRQTRLIFLGEALMIGVCSTVIGLTFSMVCITVLNSIGVQMPPPPGRNTPIPLHISWEILPSVYISLTVVGISLLASFISTARLSRVHIGQLIQGV